VKDFLIRKQLGIEVVAGIGHGVAMEGEEWRLETRLL
jgi:hypothetical protein